jgi:hypothetical protein
MIELTSEMIIGIHNAIIQRYGDLSGICTRGPLIISMPGLTMSRTASRRPLLLFIRQPFTFNDGQKRTGFQWRIIS